MRAVEAAELGVGGDPDLPAAMEQPKRMASSENSGSRPVRFKRITRKAEFEVFC